MMSKAAVRWVAAGLAVIAVAGCQNTDMAGPGVTGPETPAVNGSGEVISAECVVTFFSETEYGEYLSTQRHAIYPLTKGIIIRASEPQGEFAWRLSAGGVYASSIPPTAKETAPATAIDRDVVQAIVTCFTASAGYYDLGRARQLDDVKIDGRWYEPFELPAAGANGPKITLFRLRDEGRIDLVRVAAASGRTITAHSYNKYWLKEANRYVPSKIDIFAEDSAAGSPVRILRIDYKRFNLLRKGN